MTPSTPPPLKVGSLPSLSAPAGGDSGAYFGRFSLRRRRGQLLGRRKGLSKAGEQKARIGESLYKEGKYSVEQIARELHISKTTLYKYLRQRGVEIGASVEISVTTT